MHILIFHFNFLLCIYGTLLIASSKFAKDTRFDLKTHSFLEYRASSKYGTCLKEETRERRIERSFGPIRIGE